MPLADYLAKNYLSAESKSNKKKRKKIQDFDGLTIADDDDSSWNQAAQEDEDDADSPFVVRSELSGGPNVPSRKTTWTKVGVDAPTDSEQLAADAILADAQAESRARALEDEDAPAIVEGGDTAMMANGAMAGLQSADQVAAALKRREKAEKKAMKDAGIDPTGMAQETIYRDASGRIVNVAMKRAELRQKAQDEERKKAEEAENAKGDVQRLEKEERRQALQEAKVMTFARHADDEKLNDELKERERWNDPMAQLLASKNAAKSSKSGKSRGGRATYQGAFEPNRYGIRPGWRWDGVDRSNGFERKWFAARNKAKDRQDLEYAWQMDE